jgi:hypothetical protein
VKIRTREGDDVQWTSEFSLISNERDACEAARCRVG